MLALGKDTLGRVDALASFGPGDLEQLLVTLGLCGWVEAFARHGVTAARLPNTPEALLRVQVPHDECRR